MQQVLLGQGEGMDDDAIRCPHCGTTQVRRKSRQPRMKRFLDDQGQEQQVAVYRYYCTNSDCAHQTFTHLPPDLVPYSRHRVQLRMHALQAYELGRGTYRTTARALGISTATAYRWLTAGGSALLPVAELFGVVRSSGIVGVDEKWVKVPHNDKAPGKHRRWMYVYTAVDLWTYDLLHIAIAPHLGQDSARVFLQELRAKGYRPQVIVTDLSTDYPAAIAQVFPQAEHHLCVFHALKAWHRTLREVYGANYREQHADARALQQDLDRIFRARTKRTAQRRADRVLARRAAYVAADPDVAAVFDSLERHWPKLVNAIESRRIPLTNNATELVNRRFDQHYQNFCGFQTIETAQRYLAIFERTYRLTPFTADAQPRVRGKCPLELAGYDVSAIPLARLLAAQPPENGSDPPGGEGVPTG
jgi:transposase-like protein